LKGEDVERIGGKYVNQTQEGGGRGGGCGDDILQRCGTRMTPLSAGLKAFVVHVWRQRNTQIGVAGGAEPHP